MGSKTGRQISGRVRRASNTKPNRSSPLRRPCRKILQQLFHPCLLSDVDPTRSKPKTCGSLVTQTRSPKM
jgi:hypothetical protein